MASWKNKPRCCRRLWAGRGLFLSKNDGAGRYSDIASGAYRTKMKKHYRSSSSARINHLE